MPERKVEIIRTNYSFSRDLKKGDKIKISVDSFDEAREILKDYRLFLGIKKIKGKHFKLNENIRITLEDVYIIEEGRKEKYFGKLGEIEIDCEDEAEEILEETLKKFGINNYSGKPLLEIVMKKR